MRGRDIGTFFAPHAASCQATKNLRPHWKKPGSSRISGSPPAPVLPACERCARPAMQQAVFEHQVSRQFVSTRDRGPLIEPPFAATFNFCLHRIRGQIQFARSGDYAINDLYLLKFWETGQMGKNASKKTRQELYSTFQPILKAHRQCKVANNLDIGNVSLHGITPKGQSVWDAACLGITASLPAIHTDATRPSGHKSWQPYCFKNSGAPTDIHEPVQNKKPAFSLGEARAFCFL